MIQAAIIVIICLLLSAFFSGMEIAFVASNRLRIEIDKKSGPLFGRIIDLFTRNPGQYITTILVGNNIALVVYSLHMTVLLRELVTRLGWYALEGSIVVDTLLATLILVFTSEFLPKAIVKVNPNAHMRAGAGTVWLFYVLLWPVAKFSTWLSVGLLRLAGIRLGHTQHVRGFNRIDLTHLVDEAVDGEHESRNEHEIRLFQNALDFSERSARDCMVPRVDVEAIDVEETIETLAARFVETKFSRIMVFEGSIDNIVGYVSSKSLFSHPATIRQAVMSVDYVPESMLARQLLTSLIRQRQSVAVVIDEFGGTAGIVSLEDVLEEIFGEIDDEHDHAELIEKQTAPKEYLFSCRLEVEYLNGKYGLHIPVSDDYDTLAGYIIWHYDGIPAQGQLIEADDMQIEILRVSGSKVELARVRVEG